MTGNTALGFCLGLQSLIPQAMASYLETVWVLAAEFAELSNSQHSKSTQTSKVEAVNLHEHSQE